MSAVAKKRLTEISFGAHHPKTYVVPVAQARHLQKLAEACQIKDDEDLVDADKVFKNIFKDLPKPAVLLCGCRTRDGLTQVELARKIKTNQSAISAMEAGTRSVGKIVAKKLAKIFDTDYRAFLSR